MFVELKICERCGGLWLRPRESRATECAACAAARERLAESNGELVRARRRKARVQ
jgi:hypothetical protein